MEINRLEQLKRFLQDDPNDPFTLYALGVEYIKSDKKEALKCFKYLLEMREDYVPVYYQAGMLFAELGDPDRARDTYRKGIKIATRAGDFKAAAELSAVLSDIEDE